MRAGITVVGLGPGGGDLMTAAALDALAVPRPRYLRTRRHAAASVVEAAAAADPANPTTISFDATYDAATRIEDVYEEIRSTLVAAANAHGHICYCVPGSPMVAEHTVELLLEGGTLDVEVVAALSFVDLAWTRLGIDPFAEGVRLVDGHRFAREAAGERGPLLVGQCDRPEVLSDIKLALDDPGDTRVTVLRHLGLPDESIRTVPWNELDRDVTPDHLTTVYLPRLAAPVLAEVQSLVELVRTLREQCPWDREQTHRSLARYLTEESAEVLEAIDRLDPDDGASIDHLAEELGDLMFQVVFHAAIAAQEGWFDLAEVARGVHDKLRDRHPHVFGTVEVADAAEVAANWEAIKAAERPERTSVVDGVPVTLPSLARATKLQKRIAAAGLTVPPVGMDDQDPDEDRMGDALWRLVADCRAIGVDPEDALRRRVLAYTDAVRAAEAFET